MQKLTKMRIHFTLSINLQATATLTHTDTQHIQDMMAYNNINKQICFF